MTAHGTAHGAPERSHAVPPEPVRGAAPRLNARTAALLAARIADGSLPPGTRLFESRIAATLGTSRGPARHALAALAERGLLIRSSGRGYTVAGPGRPPAAPAEGAIERLAGERLAAPASWARLYGEVERAIVSRLPFASWRVVESELARHYGVSRTVAREVMARLDQRGLIRRAERARWIAPGLTASHMGELYELRAVLEPAALIRAAPHLAPGYAASLRRNVEAAMARARELDGAALDRLEAELHVELLGHCPNRALIAAVRQPQSLLVAHSFLYAWVPRLFPAEPFLPEHLRVLAALEAGRVAEAAEALAEHLRVSLERATARIEAVKRAPQPPALPYLLPLGDGD